MNLDEPLGHPDAVIIPGTKNTISDLMEMEEKGMADQIKSLPDTPILGICGGYQILGKEIIDCGVEDTEGSLPGLGLLDATTRFDQYEKRTVQVRKPITGGGPILERICGQEVAGYEIHMGVTESRDPAAFGDDGAVAKSGLVIGTYLHGIFDNQNLRDAFLDFLYERRSKTGNEALGIEASKAEKRSSRAQVQKGSGYRELAEAVETHLDMEKIWQMLDLNVPKAKRGQNSSSGIIAPVEERKVKRIL